MVGRAGRLLEKLLLDRKRETNLASSIDLAEQIMARTSRERAAKFCLKVEVGARRYCLMMPHCYCYLVNSQNSFDYFGFGKN